MRFYLSLQSKVKELSPIAVANAAEVSAKSLILLMGGPERTEA
jgi:hypothetical protein